MLCLMSGVLCLASEYWGWPLMPYRDPAARRQALSARRKRTTDWLAAYKGQCHCADCGESHPACLHFHHRDPREKDFTIANAASWGWGIQRILQEIQKCDVLCANCHAKRHWELRQHQKRQRDALVPVPTLVPPAITPAADEVA